MLNVVIYYSGPGVVAGFEATGHTGYAERGSDIVCAGASAIIQTALLGLDELLSVSFGLEQQDGNIYFTLPFIEDEDLECKIRLILSTMILGLRRIKQKYPENIRITESFMDEIPDRPGEGGEYPKGNGGVDFMPIEYENAEIIIPVEKDSKPYAFEKLVGVAFLGALSGLLVYYIYNQLSDESKKMVKETIVTNVKRHIASLGQVD